MNLLKKAAFSREDCEKNLKDDLGILGIDEKDITDFNVLLIKQRSSKRISSQ